MKRLLRVPSSQFTKKSPHLTKASDEAASSCVKQPTIAASAHHIEAAKSTQRAIVVFARRPEVGKVKTRLGRDIGMDAACQIYVRVLHHTLCVVSSIPSCRHLLYLPSGQSLDPTQFPIDTFCTHAQSEADLGERMHHAFLEQFACGIEQMLLIGSDLPQISADLLHRAFAALASADTVFGPAYDGGYYLIGQSAPTRDLFAGIKWSTPQVWADTQALLKHQRISYATLDLLDDLDDLPALKRILAQNNTICPLEGVLL